MKKLNIKDGSTKGSVKLARNKCNQLSAVLGNIESSSDLESSMPKLRAVLGELNQRIHEANAYNNSLIVSIAINQQPTK
tara:strand:+ start:31 stop:267 length:237 start_codon:yes stop_codon:yes gene_type:complete